MPPIGTLLTLGPIEALHVLSPFSLLQSINAESKNRIKANQVLDLLI